MNWTGGRLQRSKHSGNILSAKQKTHFAKARAKLQSGPSTVSPTIPDGYTEPIDCDSQPESRRRNEKQDEDLSPLFPTDGRRPPRSSAFTHLPPKRRGSDLERLILKECQSDIYDENPLAFKENALPIGSLEEKRRELLRRRDWIGLWATKPLKIEFPSVEERQQVGRRRKLNKRDLDRKNEVLHRNPYPCESEAKGIRKRNHLNSDELSQSQVSIRIGSSIHGSQRNLTKGHRSQSLRHRSSILDEAITPICSPPISAAMLFHDNAQSQRPLNRSSTTAHYIESDHRPKLVDEQFRARLPDQHIYVDPSCLSLHISKSQFLPQDVHGNRRTASHDSSNPFFQCSISPQLSTLTTRNVNTLPNGNERLFSQNFSLKSSQIPNAEDHTSGSENLFSILGGSNYEDNDTNTIDEEKLAIEVAEEVKIINHNTETVAPLLLDKVNCEDPRGIEPEGQRIRGKSQGQPCKHLRADGAVKAPEKHVEDENEIWWNFVFGFEKGGNEGGETAWEQPDTQCTIRATRRSSPIGAVYKSPSAWPSTDSLRGITETQASSSPDSLALEYPLSTFCNPGTVANWSSPPKIMFKRSVPFSSAKKLSRNGRKDLQALRMPKSRSATRRRMGTRLHVSSDIEEDIED